MIQSYMYILIFIRVFNNGDQEDIQHIDLDLHERS